MRAVRRGAAAPALCVTALVAPAAAAPPGRHDAIKFRFHLYSTHSTNHAHTANMKSLVSLPSASLCPLTPQTLAFSLSDRVFDVPGGGGGGVPVPGAGGLPRPRAVVPRPATQVRAAGAQGLRGGARQGQDAGAFRAVEGVT